MSLTSIIGKVKSGITAGVNSIKDGINNTVDEFRSEFSDQYNGAENSANSPNTLRYPDQTAAEGTPFMIFSQHKPKYEAARSRRGGTLNQRRLAQEKREYVTQIPGEGVYAAPLDKFICMYIPMNIQVGDSFSYDTVETGPLGAAYNIARSTFGTSNDALDMVNGDSAKVIAQQVAPAAGAAGLATVLNRLPVVGGVAAASAFPAIQAGVREYQKESQVTVNPRQFVLFRTPNLRNFSLEFKFIPTSDKESRSVVDIIRTFRSSAYPDVTDKASIGFKFPDAWTMEFVNVDGMPKIPEVVITGINVSYNPNSMSYYTKNNMPVEVVLSLTFSELAPMTRSDVLQGY